MIHTVNAMHPSPIRTTRSKTRSDVASSSSTVTYDTPRTPSSAYSHRSGGSLGEDFSIIKMGRLKSSVVGQDPFNTDAFSGLDNDCGRSLPAWLRGTISTLETRNPLRLLLPDDADTLEHPSLANSEASSNTTAVPDRGEAAVAFTRPTVPSISDAITANITARSSPRPGLLEIPMSTILAVGQRVRDGRATERHISTSQCPCKSSLQTWSFRGRQL